MKLKILVIALLLGCTLPANDAPHSELPNVLIIGDSISIGYTKPLKEILKGKANVIHNAGNAQHSRKGLAQLDSWLGKTQWDVIHFNHGLHDLKYVNKKGNDSKSGENTHIQIPLGEYRENMEAIVFQLKKTGAQLIFATTTPYPGGVDPPRIPEDAEKYNSVALGIMKDHGITVNDLYTFALPQLKTLQKPKNVHFTEDGSRVLAQEVARYITKAISKQ